MMSGPISWLAGGLMALIVARLIRSARGRLWMETAVALITSLAAGIVATALDFGGWGVTDPRAFSFAAFSAFAVLGLIRLLRLLRARHLERSAKV